jgi:hypothetical protein
MPRKAWLIVDQSKDNLRITCSTAQGSEPWWVAFAYLGMGVVTLVNLATSHSRGIEPIFVGMATVTAVVALWLTDLTALRYKNKTHIIADRKQVRSWSAPMPGLRRYCVSDPTRHGAEVFALVKRVVPETHWAEVSGALIAFYGSENADLLAAYESAFGPTLTTTPPKSTTSPP